MHSDMRSDAPLTIMTFSLVEPATSIAVFGGDARRYEPAIASMSACRCSTSGSSSGSPPLR